MDRDNIGVVSKLSNLLKSISISEDLQLVSSQEKIVALSIEESAIANDIGDFIDKRSIENKISRSLWEKC